MRTSHRQPPAPPPAPSSGLTRGSMPFGRHRRPTMRKAPRPACRTGCGTDPRVKPGDEEAERGGAHVTTRRGGRSHDGGERWTPRSRWAGARTPKRKGIRSEAVAPFAALAGTPHRLPLRHPRAEPKAKTLGSMPFPLPSRPTLPAPDAPCRKRRTRRHRHGMDPRVRPEDDEADRGGARNADGNADKSARRRHPRNLPLESAPRSLRSHGESA
ncbi:hypothetical protein NTH_03016 [Nitratireductor thuwali]|uniref:Uncharacterized protein n=1 Tax=Nitratireductor thuwali TaxID=2267699 RepID=A0ABY5MKM1_9HYPH|nr:hypothetical protein NTH_03016 [Nitratireductor thuwali]